MKIRFAVLSLMACFSFLISCADLSPTATEVLHPSKLIKREIDLSGSENHYQFKNGRLVRLETHANGEIERWIHIEYNADGQLLTEDAFNRDLYSETRTHFEYDHTGRGGITRVNRYILRPNGEKYKYAHEKFKRDASNRVLQIDYYNAQEELIKQSELEYNAGNLISEKEYIQNTLLREIIHVYDTAINPYARFNYLLFSLVPVSENNRIKTMFTDLDNTTREILEYEYEYLESGLPESCEIIQIAGDSERQVALKRYEYY